MTDTHPLPAKTIRIGRHPDNDIALGNLDVSRHHAELRRNPDGSFEIIDLGSHGGTFVNGERITHKMLTEQHIIYGAAGPLALELAHGRGEFVQAEDAHRVIEQAQRGARWM